MTETLRVNVYSSERLHHRNGRVSERVAARFLREALGESAHNVDVRTGYRLVDAPDEEAHCSGDALGEFDPDPAAKDANVLLLDDHGGGCGFISGNRCTAPARHIDREVPYRRTGEGDLYRNVGAVLHEVMHNLGSKHDHDPYMEGMQHWGAGWNEHNTLWGFRLPWGGRWHRTPCVAGNDTVNACGRRIPDRQYGKTVYHLHYTDCALNNLVVVED
jgi:hypothetical protein